QGAKCAKISELLPILGDADPGLRRGSDPGAANARALGACTTSQAARKHLIEREQHEQEGPERPGRDSREPRLFALFFEQAKARFDPIELLLDGREASLDDAQARSGALHLGQRALSEAPGGRGFRARLGAISRLEPDQCAALGGERSELLRALRRVR